LIRLLNTYSSFRAGGFAKAVKKPERMDATIAGLDR
jgi:hypothetical protein